MDKDIVIYKRLPILLSIASTFLMGLYFVYLFIFEKERLEHYALAGEAFNVFAAIFSVLAFLLLLASLMYQQKQFKLQYNELKMQLEQLQLQREEMAGSREELKRQADVQVQANKINWISQYHQLVGTWYMITASGTRNTVLYERATKTLGRLEDKGIELGYLLEEDRQVNL